MRKSQAFRIGLSIAFATGLYGISFGALAVSSGLSFWQTMALSALLFSGGSQFAFIGVIAGGGSGGAAFGAASLLGVRNAIYGMQVNQILRPGDGDDAIVEVQLFAQCGLIKTEILGWGAKVDDGLDTLRRHIGQIQGRRLTAIQNFMFNRHRLFSL